MENLDEQLNSWLDRMARVADCIKLEEDVDDCLWPIFRTSLIDDPTPAAPRLLQMLGYSPNNVFYKERFPLARGKALEPDFVIRVRGKEVLVIEDKAPSVRIDDWIGQLHAYFLVVDAPLGLMFNTRQAMLIVNTRLPELSKFKGLQSERVMDASTDDRPQMIELLSHLAAPSSRSGMLELAIGLAEKRAAEIKREQNGKRQEGNRLKRLKSITDRVSEIKADPPEYLLTAMIANDEELQQIRGAKVKTDEVNDAWLGKIAPMADGEIELRGEFSGHIFVARFNPSTRKVVYAGEPPCKATPAALCAIRTVDPDYKAVNGWRWWKYRDEKTQSFLELKTLREEPDTKG